MKTLNEYIKESLLDDEDDLVNNDSGLIEQFLKGNYKIDGDYEIKDNIVNINGNIELKNHSKALTNGLFKFEKIKGDFMCWNADKLEDIKGAPEIVEGSMAIYNCNSLKSLEGSDIKKVTGDFGCDYCKKLKSLKGCPEIVGGIFSCTECHQLENLKGVPKEIGGSLICKDCKKLKSLKGITPKIGNIDFRRTPAYSEKENWGLIKKYNIITNENPWW